MTWTCTHCERVFKNTNQSHACGTFNLEDHFERREGWLRDLYQEVLNVFEAIGPYTVDPVEGAILLKKKTAFCSVKIMKDCIQLSFRLAEKHDYFPIHKVVALSKNSWHHSVRIDEKDDLDEQLISWLKEAYDTTD